MNKQIKIITEIRISLYCMNDKDSYAVYIVTGGEGEITGEGYRHSHRQGDYFFLPYASMGQFAVQGSLEIVECY